MLFAGIISVRSTHLWEKGRIRSRIQKAQKHEERILRIRSRIWIPNTGIYRNRWPDTYHYKMQTRISHKYNLKRRSPMFETLSG